VQRLKRVLQTGTDPSSTPAQSELLRHCTHVFVVVSQWGAPAPVQSELARHWTQVSFAVLQTGRTKPPPAPASVAQLVLLRHWTHVIVLELQ